MDGTAVKKWDELSEIISRSKGTAPDHCTQRRVASGGDRYSKTHEKYDVFGEAVETHKIGMPHTPTVVERLNPFSAFAAVSGKPDGPSKGDPL